MSRFLLPVLLLGAAALLLDVAGARAQRFPRQLENIKMFGQGETIEFVFSQPYEGTPVIEHQKGAFSLSFSGTGSTKPVRSLRPVEESMYKEIKVVENRYSTTVSFQLKDPGLNLKNKLAFTPDKKVLKVTVDAPAPRPAPASPQGQASQDLLREMESRIAGGAAAAEGAGMAAAPPPGASGSVLALGDLGGTQFFYSLVTMVIALVIIVGALYGVLYLYNRFLASRLRRFTGSHAIRQVAAFHIGPRQRIVVLEINDELIACGVTPAQITYLTHLGGKGPVGRRLAGDAGGLPGTEGDAQAGPGSKALQAVNGGVPAGSADPVHQFAEVLKQKVRSLKRIN
jgi:hypothetical protein